MRLRNVLYIVAGVLIVAFALLNWQEITRPTTLNLGFDTVTAPLGLILLGLLLLASLIFMAASASSHTRYLMETRQHAKAMQAQRELAEKAETSRFVELRQHLDNHLRESRQRESNSASEIEQTVSRIQRELRQQVEQVQRSLSTRMGEMEARLTRRMDGDSYGPTDAVPRPTGDEVLIADASQPAPQPQKIDQAG
ncbi:hypothetical protein [Ramlibacter rhizophilus]|uniref:LapA family protein n=1 Tax=Ramlibacter rhizophilus TaxID=1781167 RepID=A0A4Z0C0C1_9BURK|nr:hypothetical protein [Ramlibacter rhizophilus]TFZ04973.1 hypothetical protein EZ242_04285 [Ramlibacter rhizophilus]